MSKIYYISDLLLEDLVGGGELNDHELCEMLTKEGCKLTKTRSHEVNLNNLLFPSLFSG